MRRAFVLALVTGCPKPPPPPSVTEPPSLPAEASCGSTTAMPALPPKPVADPFRLTHAAQMQMTVDGASQPIAFLCDLPDHILGLAATQTVDGGRRVVGGVVHAHPRTATARALPKRMPIAASSPGCKQGELACAFETEAGTIEMLREQWIHTSGWVHRFDDMCRALPDDTIAVCSTASRMAYVELGCDGELHVGIHDTQLPRKFDLDVESPVIRMRGGLDVMPTADSPWTFSFRGGKDSTAAPTTKSFTAVNLVVARDLASATLNLDNRPEPCVAWAIYRR
ncbi:MAG: hypothetical protein ACKV2T_18835 [Kofleriaceae bacterium]